MPETIDFTLSPTSRQIFSVTGPLSPVSTLSLTPAWERSSRASLTDVLGGPKNAMQPSRPLYRSDGRYNTYTGPGFLGHGFPVICEPRRKTDGIGNDTRGAWPPQRWSARRKRDVVLRLLRGEALDAVSRQVGVEISRLEAWRDQALTGMEGALKHRESDPLAEDLKAAKLRHFGITSSFAFLKEPETNGVVQRFFRTLKEQVL